MHGSGSSVERWNSSADVAVKLAVKKDMKGDVAVPPRGPLPGCMSVSYSATRARRLVDGSQSLYGRSNFGR
jgi:hypothetical protein